MRIKEVREEYLEFDNGMVISSDHAADCCEWNYADFTQLLDTVAMDYDFDENLVFEEVNEGFRFGNEGQDKFFVPCYSVQNGYYSDNVTIYFNGEEVISDLVCEMR